MVICILHRGWEPTVLVLVGVSFGGKTEKVLKFFNSNLEGGELPDVEGGDDEAEEEDGHHEGGQAGRLHAQQVKTQLTDLIHPKGLRQYNFMI